MQLLKLAGGMQARITEKGTKHTLNECMNSTMIWLLFNWNKNTTWREL
jgi:hypothetical protein